MAHAFERDGDRLVARLDTQERQIVAELMEQVRELIEPEGSRPPLSPSAGTGDDPFDAIVAGLGGSFGVSVSAEDQRPDPVVPDSPADLPGRDFGLERQRDPALDRLFPAGNREDEQVASEYRRLTEPGLRSRKVANLDVALAALDAAADSPTDEVVVDVARAPQFLIALTDVRLVMGDRLGLRTDDDADRIEAALADADDDDPTVFAMAVYDFLTWLQETLTLALTRQV
ncbi:DUF2017 family protein [Janibacter sp. G1551]|uniref:DUF2017 family protein n=1 Tax=Janibacter sp. G1551 TaxID=3420440 RepID=UPI003D0474C8